MQKVKAFGDWLTKWFTAIVIVWAVFNYFVPQASLWGKSYTGYFLGIVLFGMGLTLTLDDFRRILTQPLMVVVGTVAHFVIMPLVVKVVLFPIALGVICHAIFGEKIEKITVALPIVSQVAILLIIGVVVAANGPKLFVASSLLAIPVVILHNLCGYALGFGFSKLMYKVYPKGFRYAQQKAITFEVGMQDSALGATLALTSFASNPLAAVPSTFFSVWHNISGSVLSSWWREHDDRHQIHPDSDNGEKGSAAKAREDAAETANS